MIVKHVLKVKEGAGEEQAVDLGIHARLTTARSSSSVIPADAGIQSFQELTNHLDPGFRRGDGDRNRDFILRLALDAGRKALLPDKAICWRVWGEMHPGRP